MQKQSLFKLLILFLVCSSILYACSNQDHPDSNDRGFDEEYLHNLNKSEAYNYDKTIEVKSGQNPLLEILGLILSGLAWFLNSVFGYMIIAFLIGLLIWMLIRNSKNIFEKKKSKEKEKLIVLDPVEVEEKDYNKLINAALKKGDFRFAIRFGFLSCLKYLHKNECLEWKMDKTNLDYLMEIPHDLHVHFNSMTLIYEQVWYGGFKANKELFDALTSKFHEIKSAKSS